MKGNVLETCHERQTNEKKYFGFSDFLILSVCVGDKRHLHIFSFSRQCSDNLQSCDVKHAAKKSGLFRFSLRVLHIVIE
jgi:hypothetical protein